MSLRLTKRPSAFETAFCVTTMTSLSSNLTPCAFAASRMCLARSSPGWTSGMPSMPVMLTLIARSVLNLT